VRLRFRAESWVDLVDLSGTHVERGIVPAGSELRYSKGQLAQVTLGDADAVDVSLAGAPLDLAPFRDAKVARFTVSSDGRIARD
jgi:cytoskeleton protein RodZ